MRNIDEMKQHLSQTDSNTQSFRSIDRLPISAPTQERAVEIARKLLEIFHDDLSEEAYHAQIEAAWRAARGPSRWVLSARDSKGMRQAIEEYIFENIATASGHRQSAARKVVFVFSGMGPQWGGMGRDLASNLPRFAEHIDYIDTILEKYYGASVWDELNENKDAEQLPTALAQTGNFLIQAAMFHLLTDENVVPEAIVGHSAGEVAAAYAAGVYTLEEAAQVAVARGRLQATLAGRGSMLAVGLSHEEALKQIEEMPQISIAAVNDDQAVTVAGDTDQIEILEQRLKAQSVFAKRLRVEVPYHSPVMDEITGAIISELSFLKPSPATTRLYSTVSGSLSDGSEWGAEYWAKNIRQPVLFAEALKCALADNKNCFIEVAPHPVLAQSIDKLAVESTGISIHHLLSRRKSEYEVFHTTLCELAISSVGRPKRVASAPLIKPSLAPQTLWEEDPEAATVRQGKLVVPELPLLGRRIAGLSTSYEVELSTGDQPWIEGHAVQGLGAIVPATMWAELFALAAAEGQTANLSLLNLTIVQALPVIPSPTVVKTTVEGVTAKCYSRLVGEPHAWTLHAVTSIAPISESETKLATTAAVYEPDAQGQSLTPDAVYNAFRIKGLNYTNHFRNLTEITVGTGYEAWATISGIEPFKIGQHSPWVLDAGLQLLIVAAKNWSELMYLPFRIGRVSLYRRMTEESDFQAHAEIKVLTPAELIGTVRYFDGDGQLLAELEDITCLRNFSDDGERINYLDRNTYAMRMLTLEEIAERDALAEAEAEEESEEASNSAEAAAQDAPETEALSEQEETAEEEEIPQLEEFWVAERDNQQLFERPSLDIDSIETDSKAHILLAVPNQNLQQDILETVEIIQRIGKQGIKSVTLTLIGHTGQNWLFGLRRSAANAYGYSVRVINRDENTSDDMLQAVITLTTEHEVIFDGDEPLMRRLDQVTSSELRAVDGQQIESEAVQQSGVPSSTLSFEFVRGQMSKMVAIREPLRQLGRDEICVEVEASPMMWKDIGKALGTIASATVNTFSSVYIGAGISGTVIAAGPDARFRVGDYVVGAAQRGYRKHIIFSKEETRLLRIVPEGVEGAVAVSHITAWLVALTILDNSNIKPGSTIFIQSGAGSLGLVLCLRATQLGFRVVTSVGAEEKIAEVKKIVPEAEVIVARGELIPAALVKAGYHGFDRVFATATGKARTTLISLLTDFGQYIDLGKPEKVDEQLLAATFDGNKGYQVLDMDQIMKRVPGWLESHLDQIVELVKDPANLIPVHRYPIEDAPQAMADLAQGITTGCIAIEITPDYCPPVVNAITPVMNPQGQYLITGGYGAVGLICAQWLSTRGAKSIILAGSSGKANAAAQATIDLIESNGTEITIAKCDTSDQASVLETLQNAAAGGRTISGVIHAAGLISDGHFDEIGAERIAKSYGPKLEGAYHVVNALEQVGMLDDIEFLLFTSSISSVLGLSVQGTYASANAGLDGLAEELCKRNINACALQLGPIEDVSGSGMAAEDNVQRYFSAIGMSYVTPRQLNGVLDLGVVGNAPHFTTDEVDWVKNSRAEPPNASSSVMREIVAKSAAGGGQAELGNLMALDVIERTEVLTKTLLGLFTEALGVEELSLNAEINFSAMGIDSLSIMEVQANINSLLQQDLPLSRLFTQDGNIGQLAARISEYLEENNSAEESAA